MLEQRHEEESVRMESDILKIKVQLWYRYKLSLNYKSSSQAGRDGCLRS